MNETDLLRNIEPAIESAFESHMQMPVQNDELAKIRQPIDPLKHLANVSKTGSLDPHVHGPVIRRSYGNWRQYFEEDYGIDITTVTAASFLVNLLTEDNLPHYTAVNYGLSDGSEPLQEWVKEWTVEEDAHGVLMRDFALHAGLIATGGVIEPSEYQAGRVQQLRTGTEIDPPSIYHALSYLTLQEQLTLEAHRNLSWILDPMGRKIMRPIAGDEQNHYEFYRSISQAALDVEPDHSLIAMANVYRNFDMPGKKGIPGFNKHALTISVSGIFDLETITNSEKLGIAKTTPKTDEGKQAQEQIIAMTSDETAASMRSIMESLRDTALHKTPKSKLAPFIIGRTIDWDMQGSPGHKRRSGLVSLLE